MFIQARDLAALTWQAYERMILRLLQLEGFDGVRLVGQTNDKGADILAHRNGRRWLVQVKHWRAKAGLKVVDETLAALHHYKADVPVIVASRGFESNVAAAQVTLQREGVPLQLWSNVDVASRIGRLADLPAHCPVQLRPYQLSAIDLLTERWRHDVERRAMVVLATGLGKTTVAAETIRRWREIRPSLRVLAIAHTIPLVLQLERSFWPFLASRDRTLVWTGVEKPSISDIASASFVFGTLDSVSPASARDEVDGFDLLLIDECHHVGPAMYRQLITETRAGTDAGPFLLGLTATPWRPDEVELEDYFGPPLVSVDIVEGLKQGFLADIDYRLYTDNIRWDAFAEMGAQDVTPKAINRKLFIDEWDDAVVHELRRTWPSVKEPRCIVFCGTIDHALVIRDRINSLGFARAEAIYSGSARGKRLAPHERNLLLAEFEQGQIQVMCAVDIFNEGIDVPDVNLIVFQRVTHSRRIFVQQLGRGLRLREGKDKVVVLDFVSDIRRFAAGLDMKDRLAQADARRVRLGSTVAFRRAGSEDERTEAFLREWLEDVAAVEAAGDDAAVLRFPPDVSRR